MTIEILEEFVSDLPDYATVPIRFTIDCRYRVEAIQAGLGGMALVEEAVTPFVKDYDAIAGEGPLCWEARLDLRHWGILGAFDDGRRIGGAAVAWRTNQLEELRNRNDAALWDLRVHPEYRRQGIGRRLFARAIEWAVERRCRRLTVETQNINVPACRFYAAQGCQLGSIDRLAYHDSLNEVRLTWYMDL